MSAISLCMIVKNEESNLDRCLSSIAGFMDEIVIVDTGSTDSTKEIAWRYTHKVFDYTWNGDFAASRNYAISKSDNEFILVLDADEYVENIDINEIKRLIQLNPSGIGRILLTNEFTRNGNKYMSSERLSRLFSKVYYEYNGVIHEQITPIIEMERTIFNIPLKVNHLGYDGDIITRRKKSDRNILLLKKALSATPNDPYLLYQFGKSYYMAEEYTSASDYFGQALYFDLDIRLEYVQDMVEMYGYSLINSEQYEMAMQLLNIYNEFSKSADFVFLIALILMNNEYFERAIIEFEKAATYNTSKMEGVNSYLAFYNIGAIYECLGDSEKAVAYYRNCVDYEPAIIRLEHILEQTC